MHLTIGGRVEMGRIQVKLEAGEKEEVEKKAVTYRSVSHLACVVRTNSLKRLGTKNPKIPGRKIIQL